MTINTKLDDDLSSVLAGLPTVAALRVLDEEMAAEFSGVSARTFRRLVKDGAAPKPIALSPRRIGWRLGELAAWIESKSPKAA